MNPACSDKRTMKTLHRSRKCWVVAGVIACLLTGAAVGAGVFYALNQTQAKCASPPAPAEPCPVPRATIDSGRLRGICRPAMQGRPQYAAFLGIPYAKPPLGELRFKAPRPVERWDGVREATLLGQECIQGSVDRQKGSEDCLVLNVYSPRLPQPLTQTQAHPPLPVLVHVHGGSMVEGSGNMIRPDYFVAQDLVVVTFNYRLGRFGFLNLDNDLAPGNAALKDMIAALKWINRNIQHFGGDPKQVTIQGCSSAAACVHWLTLLPETEDLFRGAIIKSGSALESWAYTEQHRGLSDGALAFFKKWPFSQNLTASQILHNMGTLALDLAFTYAEAHRVKNSPENVMPISVSTEKHRQKTLNEPKLVVRDPESYLLVPDRTPVPILMGVTNCEYVPIAEMNFMLDQLPAVNSTDFELMVPRSLIPMGDTMKALNIDAHSYGLNFSNAADDLRAVMFNLTAVDPNCDLECRWEQYVSDTRMSVDSIRSIRMHARNKKQPVYAYFYEYPLAGSCAYHATDDALVWVQDVDRLMQLNTTHPLALNVMRQVALFSNFAKHGKPVLETDAEVLTTEWPPMNEKGPDVFLRIGVNLTVDHSDMMGKFGSFWETEYAKYREGKGI